MSEAPGSSSPWLYGPLPDLFFGCGLLFAVVCLVFSVNGGAIFHGIPIVVPTVLIALISMPHYGATLLRVYDRREDRQGYFLFSVVATGLLLAVFGVALFDRFTGSVLATVYLTWSGWHYTGQNYGIASMFLRRRGIAIDGVARRLLHTSFTLSFLIVFLVMHGQVGSLADPSIEVRLIPLGIPHELNLIAIRLVIAGYLATSLAWFVLLARRAEKISDLAPTLLISVTQALWWSIPYSARMFDFLPASVPLGWGERSLFFPWIACAHALQYLWITSYYVKGAKGAKGAKGSDGWPGQLRYYGLVLVAGSAVWALPAVAFAPGSHSFDWNFALLLAATVNIHHFILDGAIWKLRSMKIASILIANVEPAPESTTAASGVLRSVLRKTVWAVSILGLLVSATTLAERFVIKPAAQRRGDLEAVAASLDRQAWLGSSNAFARFRLGRAFQKSGEAEAAAEQFEMSADIEPRVESIKRLIAYYQNRRDRVGLVASCDRLFALPTIPRTVPTPNMMKPGNAIPPEFLDACVAAARRARPVSRKGSDPTGGAGQDGGAAAGIRYE